MHHICIYIQSKSHNARINNGCIHTQKWRKSGSTFDVYICTCTKPRSNKLRSNNNNNNNGNNNNYNNYINNTDNNNNSSNNNNNNNDSNGNSNNNNNNNNSSSINRRMDV